MRRAARTERTLHPSKTPNRDHAERREPPRVAPSIVGARVPASNRAVKVAARGPKAVKTAAFHDPDQYDHDANSGRGSGFVATRAPAPSSKAASGGARPTRVTRGADGVVYDPDQFDADANQRSGGVAVRPAGAAAQGVGSNTKNPRFALLFDCDGVIVETEELHRKAYNASFKHFGLVCPGQGQG